MKFDAIQGLVGELAPTIGAALGGPVGGAAAGIRKASFPEELSV